MTANNRETSSKHSFKDYVCGFFRKQEVAVQLVGVILLGITILYAHCSVSKMKEANDLIKKEQDESGIQANKTLSLFTKNMELVNRAWIFVDTMTNKKVLTGLAISARLKNSGHSTAKGCALIKFGYRLPKEPEPHLPAEYLIDFLNTAKQHEGHMFVMGPGQTITVNAIFPLSESQKEDIQKGKLLLYSYGHIEYADPINKHGQTDIAFVFDPITDGWLQCDQGNDAK